MKRCFGISARSVLVVVVRFFLAKRNNNLYIIETSLECTVYVTINHEILSINV